MAAPFVAVARAGETLDALVNRVVGRTGGVVEAVLAANPGAARLRLAEGDQITIPATALIPPAAPLIDLWD